MDPRVEKILKLPNKQKVALLILIVLLEAVAFFYGLQQPKYKEFKELQAKLNDLQNQIQENKKITDNLPRLKKEYEQLQNELQAALTELPIKKRSRHFLPA